MTESPHHHALINDDGSWKYTNALADETSPYLRQHAHNPVDWRPWGEPAFAEAARREVPIFLSIGYSTCYWCHVMERQVFENPKIARQMNEQFVCVKVDREERPDVDDIYMTATQLLTGSGGWPMSVFLTPPAPGSAQSEGEAVEHIGRGLLPFWAGTYIPPTPAYGRPSFTQVMDAMSQAWRDERDQVIAQSGRVADAVRNQVAQGGGAGPVTLDRVQRTASQLQSRYDPTHGGFSGPQGPKFPTPSTVALLLDLLQHEPDEALEKQVRHTLDRMAMGGMYDQVGGGFHRYSVDEQWLVPHFEKMLYDNGQLLELYAHAYEVWGEQRYAALYARVVRETAEYLLREMLDGSADSGGAFWSAQDAEVNTKEGENYVWTPEQIRAALASEDDAERLTALALKMYGLERGTNFQDPHHRDAPAVNVLFMPESMSALVEFADGDMGGVMRMRERINAALLAVRDTRDQPGTDDKVLVAWNGLVIAGLAHAGRVMDEPRYIAAAQRAAVAILKHMSQPGGGLLRSMRKGEAKINAFLEDYAFFAHGLLALDQALPDEQTRYRDQAVRLMRIAHEQFAAPRGGYFDTLADQADLFVRTRSTYDGAIPSGNSQMIHNLLRLRVLTGDDAYARQAVLDLRSFAGALEQSGLGMTHMLRAALHAVAELPAMWTAALEEADAGASETARPVTVQVKPIENETGAYRVLLTVAEGYHLNANPASAEGLIATTVSAAGMRLDVTYPPAERERYAFADAPLDVYTGRVEIVVRADQSITELTLTYQACTDAACLEPVTRTLNLR